MTIKDYQALMDKPLTNQVFLIGIGQICLALRNAAPDNVGGNDLTDMQIKVAIQENWDKLMPPLTEVP